MSLAWSQFLNSLELLHLEWPMVWLLLPLPWLARRYLVPRVVSDQPKLRLPMTQATLKGMKSSPSYNLGSWGKIIIMSFIWLLLLFALSRPQFVGQPQPVDRNVRDLMLSIDISASMLEDDFFLNGESISRLTAVQAIGSDFISQRKNDRIGLILFGQVAYLQSPLTYDHKSITSLLNDAFARMAGNATAIGDAIGLSVKALQDQPENARVLILLTDGENTAGVLSVDKAIELAQAIGLKIYTIGVGSEAQPSGQQGLNNQQFMNFFNTIQRQAGPSIDEKTMQKIASATNGQYYRAKNLKELNEIYNEIDRLEPRLDKEQIFRPVKDIFYIPLFFAGTLFLMYLFGLASLPTQRKRTISNDTQMNSLDTKDVFEKERS